MKLNEAEVEKECIRFCDFLAVSNTKNMKVNLAYFIEGMIKDGVDIDKLNSDYLPKIILVSLVKFCCHFIKHFESSKESDEKVHRDTLNNLIRGIKEDLGLNKGEN